MDRSRRTTVTIAVFTAVVAVGALVLAYAWGRSVGSADEDTFTTRVVKVSSDGDSVCIDRPEDSCGLPIVLPDERSLLQSGARVDITEIWLREGNSKVLAFYLKPPSD